MVNFKWNQETSALLRGKDTLAHFGVNFLFEYCRYLQIHVDGLLTPPGCDFWAMFFCGICLELVACIEFGFDPSNGGSTLMCILTCTVSIFKWLSFPRIDVSVKFPVSRTCDLKIFKVELVIQETSTQFYWDFHLPKHQKPRSWLVPLRPCLSEAIAGCWAPAPYRDGEMSSSERLGENDKVREGRAVARNAVNPRIPSGELT